MTNSFLNDIYKLMNPRPRKLQEIESERFEIYISTIGFIITLGFLFLVLFTNSSITQSDFVLPLLLGGAVATVIGGIDMNIKQLTALKKERAEAFVRKLAEDVSDSNKEVDWF